MPYAPAERNPIPLPEIAQGRNAPVGPLATDASVNAAYQALMQAIAQGDLNKDYYRSQLTTNLGRSKLDREKSLLMANQSAADRGMLSSGAALSKQGDVNTQFDQYDTDIQDQVTNALRGIDTNITGLETGYGNEQIAASGRWTAAQAAAADAAIQRQADRDAADANTAALMAALAPQPAPAPYMPPLPPAMIDAPLAVTNKPRPKPIPVSGQTGYIAQKRIAGPQ